MTDTNGRKHFVNCIIGNWQLRICHWPWVHIHVSLPASPYSALRLRGATQSSSGPCRSQANWSCTSSQRLQTFNMLSTRPGHSGAHAVFQRWFLLLQNSAYLPTRDIAAMENAPFACTGRWEVVQTTIYVVVQAASESASHAPQIILPSSGHGAVEIIIPDARSVSWGWW